MAAPKDAPTRRSRTQPKGNGMKPFYILLALVVIIGVAFIGYSMMKKDKAATAAPEKTLPVVSAEELIQKAKPVLRGQNTAPVKLMVFSDYQCPWCAIYATTIEPQVKAAFVDAGKVVEIYHDFPLGGEHKYSFLVARAARCAEDQGKFWEYHDNVFSKQRDWSYEQTPPTKTLKKYAGDLGLDQSKFDACIESDTHSDVVEYNRQLGEQAGVNSTPTVFINGKKAAHPEDWDKLKADIEAAIGAGH